MFGFAPTDINGRSARDRLEELQAQLLALDLQLRAVTEDLELTRRAAAKAELQHREARASLRSIRAVSARLKAANPASLQPPPPRPELLGLVTGWLLASVGLFWLLLIVPALWREAHG